MSYRRAPAWYPGWNIVAAATALTLLTVGMRMGIGPFFLQMAHDLGISRSALAGIVAAGMLCYGLGMPLAGWLAETAGYNALFIALTLAGLYGLLTLHRRVVVQAPAAQPSAGEP